MRRRTVLSKGWTGGAVNEERDEQSWGAIVRAALDRVERFHEGGRRRLAPRLRDAELLRDELDRRFGRFLHPLSDAELVEEVDGLLAEGTLHITHPRYFGLFNPNVTPASVAGDVFTAGYNPQLAAWSHAPFANEVERFTLDYLGTRLGWELGSFVAHFTAGGAEANHSALAVALAERVPAFVEDGLTGPEEGRPVFYASQECHHSLSKIAVLCGLGRRGLRSIPVDADLRMSVEATVRAVGHDRARGLRPFALVATAGTTGAGVVDPLEELAELCAKEGLWFHVDAAWGGAACLSERVRSSIRGIAGADSVTWDAHKWLSVPMGAGMFFCRRPKAVDRAFDIDTPYMPHRSAERPDPYASTMQWSRRLTGLKVFMALASAGEEGTARRIDHQVAMGDLLRAELRERGWRIVNDTELPLVCFTRDEVDRGDPGAPELADALEREDFWISPIRLAGGPPVLRACVTNYRTQEEDIVALAEAVTRRVVGG